MRSAGVWRRWVLVPVAMLLVVVAGVPAWAAAPLGGREWWFDAWSIESKVWPETKGAGVTVAVIDSGVNASLPELSGVVLPGYDATGGNTEGRKDFDPDGHGTGMAALIAGQGAGSGMLGIAPGVRILPVYRGSPSNHDEDLPTAIRWAVDHGAQVVNMSIGIPGACDADTSDAIRYATQSKDAVVVVAAGNIPKAGDFASFPADCPGVLAVGAVGPDGEPWSGSVHQDYVSVAAPGTEMVRINAQGRIGRSDGTSDAAALTSGVVALVRSAHPQLSARQVVARILATLVNRPAGGGKDPQRGYGTVQADAAVLANVPADAPNPVYDALGPPPSASASASSSSGAGAAPGGSAGGGSGVPVWVWAAAGLGVVAVVVLVVVVARRRPAGAGPGGYAPPGPYPPPVGYPPGPGYPPPPAAPPAPGPYPSQGGQPPGGVWGSGQQPGTGAPQR